MSLHLSDVAWVQVLSLEGGLARLLYSSEEALSPGRHELGGLDPGPESPLQILAVASPRESPLPYEQADGACLLSLADSLPPGPPGSSRAQVHLATLPAQSWLCRALYCATARAGLWG